MSETQLRPDEQVLQKTREYRALHPELTFTRAKQTVLELNPELAKEYTSAGTIDDDAEQPDAELMREIKTYRVSHPQISFAQAKHNVMLNNPDLAQRYVDQPGAM